MKTKFKRVTAVLASVTMILGMFLNFPVGTFDSIFEEMKVSAEVTAKQPDAGDGSTSSPYQIDEAGELLWFADFVNQGGENLNANAWLMSDIDMTGITDYVPIGNISTFINNSATITDKGYCGIFDGQGFVIKNLTLDRNSLYVTSGIFGTVSGTVKNLGVDNYYYNKSNANLDGRFGAVAGLVAPNGTIEDCYAINSTVKSGNRVAGIIAGSNYSGTIQNCFTYDCVTSGRDSGDSHRYGWIVGDNKNDGTGSDLLVGTVNNCYTDGERVASTQSDGENGCKSAVASEVFESGEIAYLLANGRTDSIWGQNIGTENAPVLNGTKVYQVAGYKGCTAETEETVAYSNTENDIVFGDHAYENGICSVCGEIEAAELNAENVYEISSAGQLKWFADFVNSGNTTANAVLTADIDMSAVCSQELGNWTPIGNDTNLYTGTFDGKGKTISKLYFDDSDVNCVGIFGGSNGTIKNIGVVDSNFNGNMRVGGICGYNEGTIENCCNSSTVSGVSNVGGICGRSKNGTISNCYNTGTFSGTSSSSVGNDLSFSGICGFNLGGTISNCFSTGTAGSEHNANGICGINDTKITNCYYLADSETDEIDGTTFKTAEAFASGEVAYLLQGEQTEAVWGQNINNGETVQAFPVLSDATVYQVKKYEGCDVESASSEVYSNTNADIFSNHESFDENGICFDCGGYEPAVWNETDSVYEISNAGQLAWFAGLVNGTLIDGTVQHRI